MSDRLQQILVDVRRRLEERRAQTPEAVLRSRVGDPARGAGAASGRERRSLVAAVQGGRDDSRPRIIAEIKYRSPAAGDLGIPGDAARRARQYGAGGACAVSVVTEPDHFGGDPADLERARAAGLPVLRKDFVIDAYQLLESVLLGADAVLLIARILAPRQLVGLLAEARELGLEALVEVNDEADVERALAAGADLIGINSRDLRTFEIDPGRTERLLALLPEPVSVVAASGLKSPGDVRFAHSLGVDACLVGEALMRAADPAGWLAAAREPLPAATARPADEQPLWVKICGVTDETAVLAAQNAGADAVGFVFAESPRRVEPARARRLAARLRRPLARVGVFVDTPPDRILRIARAAGLTHLQLHGDEADEEVVRLQAAGYRVLRAYRVNGPEVIARAAASPADLVLLDAYDPARRGGTGRAFDWDLAVDLCRRRRVILAGGLTPHNVGDAVRAVLPFGVDVSSGVERSPGIKDPARIAGFVHLAQSAWQSAVVRATTARRKVIQRVRDAT
ncbi:MAG TPA: bifunctional indole-3-glycerol phosphate synthase/phosphoribosylanthranilate isomerase [Bacillota bacterium]